MIHHQIEQLYPPLFGYVNKHVNIREDAEDLTQDIFFKLAKSNKDGVENIKSWVYTIAKNTITDYYRRKKVINEELNDNVPSVEDEHEVAKEMSECVTSFVNLLPQEYREILTLSELKGVSQKEIAKQLDLNYVTVRSKVQRGRKKLKELFESCCTILQGGKGSILEYKEKKGCDPNVSCHS